MDVAGAERRSSLEHRTKLVEPGRGSWTFVLYPDAAEGGGAWRSGAEEPGSGLGLGVAPEQSAADAARRARGHVRRYCAANRLNRLGTLTYRGSGCHDRRRLGEDVHAFFRRLRQQLGERLPYLWTPEWHPGGHGLHVHFAVGRFIRRGWIEEAWPHGFVHIKLLGDLPVGSTSLAEARVAARYLSKYLSKDAGAVSGGLHRYEVGQGFQPKRWRLDGKSRHEVLTWAAAAMDRPPEYVWDSRDQEGWLGPPAVWASWA